MANTEIYKDMYCKLTVHWDIYQKLHSRTANTDRRVVAKCAGGKNVVQTALEIPCSESTVYCAINRVKKFISEELRAYEEKRYGEFYVHRAIGLQMGELSMLAFKLYIMFVNSYQRYEQYTRWEEVHECLSGLRNKQQRESVLAELNKFTLIPDEEPHRSVKIFDCVTYARGKYLFQFTAEALPYYDMDYAILSMFEANMK